MNFDFELWRVYYNRTMERSHFCHLNLCVNNKPYLGVRCFCLISEFYLNILRETFIYVKAHTCISKGGRNYLLTLTAS